MPVAIRAITRLIDADDVNVTPAVGVDEYALTYDHDTARFVLRAPAAAPDLSGYALLAGRAGGQTLYGGTAANDDITIHGTSDATRTTSYVLLQPTAGNVGIGTAAPAAALHVVNLASTAAPVRISEQSGAGGMSLNAAAGYSGLGCGCYWSGSQWIALNTAAVLFYKTESGAFSVYNNSGLTVGNPFAPTERFTFTVTGRLGIGTTAPDTIIHAVSTTAVTNALRNVFTLGSNVTGAGVGAAGLGPAIVFQAESTTTVDTTQAAIEASWIVATHATRASRLALKAYDTAEREGIRIDASGTAALLGFYGHAAAAQPSAYTPSNVSADRAFDADTVLVAELADVVGTLIADLQSIGLLA